MRAAALILEEPCTALPMFSLRGHGLPTSCHFVVGAGQLHEVACGGLAPIAYCHYPWWLLYFLQLYNSRPAPPVQTIQTRNVFTTVKLKTRSSDLGGGGGRWHLQCTFLVCAAKCFSCSGRHECHCPRQHQPGERVTKLKGVHGVHRFQVPGLKNNRTHNACARCAPFS